MPTLYHHPVSAASRFIRLAFGEYCLEADLVEERTWERRADFMAMNPAGTLPVYVDESLHAVCGAGVIAEFIDETHGALKRERRLFADNVLDRAENRRLMDWFLHKMEQDVPRHLVRERILKLLMPKQAGGGAPDSAALRMARANLQQHLRYVDWLAGSRHWLSGEKMSYADLAAAASLSVLDYIGEVKWDAAPQAKSWYQRLKSRPAFRPLLADRIRNIAPVSNYADLDF